MAPLVFDTIVGAMRAGRTPCGLVMGSVQLLELRRDAERLPAMARYFKYAGEHHSSFAGCRIRIEGTLDGWRLECDQPEA